jgi:hypothetical protein
MGPWELDGKGPRGEFAGQTRRAATIASNFSLECNARIEGVREQFATRDSKRSR